jgi:uncharacterized protein (UPF0261 family)
LVGAVLVLATLDTKGEEARFLADAIRARGCDPRLVDLSVGGRGVDAPASLPVDQAMERVAVGAAEMVGAAVGRGEVAGVIGLGGGRGTWLATAVMRTLPLGLPKLMVSTVASRDVHPFVGHSDIAMMPSVVDVAGLNGILRAVLRNAAGAICGMAAPPGAAEPTVSQHARVALTMFGVTTPAGTRIRVALEALGYEVVVFHANGVGGATMEQLIAAGEFVGVVDLSTTELADDLVGGIRGAGPHRLEAAGARGVPQVVVPGAVDVVNFGPPDTVPARFAERRLHAHSPTTTLMRTSIGESATLGGVVAAKLNRATAPVTVLLPMGGFSSLDAPGGPFEDAAADRAFADALREALRDGIALHEVPDHINSEALKEAVVEAVRNTFPTPVPAEPR